ncbi:hypothetical protein Q2K19_13245 [Micromonospora soli]|uniref:hypothetical protein n=1 Tax=Micromonospora sp. NBRC 110009 TaxID=3061627 RepID=UPI002671A034|nr:hypothetical protein [Micromonospora sp. NBRC 110009]WKU01359.1 hypothetical protein Q2K19_13245 [Micromonospora sp. NBRC 110009]
MRSTPAAAALLAALLLPVSACARTGEPAADGPAVTAPPSASATPTEGGGTAGRPGVEVVLTKSGGIAGLTDTITVRPDGRWTRVDRAGTARTGQLDAADLDRLRRLTADPRLAAEATATSTTMCADAFTYQLTVGPITTGYVDCPPEATPPAGTAAVVDLLTRATE